jgi:hypothetical protein
MYARGREVSGRPRRRRPALDPRLLSSSSVPSHPAGSARRVCRGETRPPQRRAGFPFDVLEVPGQQIPDRLVGNMGGTPQAGELLPFMTEQRFGQRAHALAPREARGDSDTLRLHGLNPMAVFSDERLDERALRVIHQGTRTEILPYRLKVTGVETYDRYPPCRVCGEATDDHGGSVACRR